MASASLHGFETHQNHLARLAYRMLGSVSDAEDVVQDAWLRWQEADKHRIGNPRAYLATVVTRLCLDQLKSARRRRETYVGPWLPEPLIEDPSLATSPDDDIADDVSVALMLALERLSPLERAAFILHDAFDMGFDEIAGALGRSEAACRQLAARARAHLSEARPRFSVAPAEAARMAEAFFAASRSGDATALRNLLATDAVLVSDGGGRKRAALRPVVGAAKIVRFFVGLLRKAGRTAPGVRPDWFKPLLINGLPGFATIDPDGTLQTTTLEIVEGRIAAIYVTRNPDKLAHVARIVPTTL